MLPAFHPQRLLALGPVITETTAAMLDRWERFAARSQPLDVLSEMTDLTRLIIVRAVLGDVTPEEARAVGRTLDSVFERTDERLWSALPWAWHFLGPRSRQSPRALRALDAFVRGKIEDSRRRSLAAPNLASTLLDTPDPGTGQGMSGAELRNEIHTDADFWRLTLAYERKILQLGPGGTLVGSAGLTYVYFNPKVNGNPEDFYLQELPVPVLGLRMDYPLGDRLFFTASLAGGVLPRVDSGRKEGGTVFLQQSHADASLGLTYALTPALHVHASYRLRYFTQHELSHEDNNAFLLLDNGFRLGLSYRF